MSCYAHHLTPIFNEAHIADMRANREAADRILRDLLGMPHAPCADVWDELKRWLDQPSPRALIVEDLRRQLNLQPLASG
jgi:hypothetical protein